MDNPLRKSPSLQPSTDDFDEEDRAQKQEREAKRRKELDAALDIGLEETFPGSDPVAVVQPPHSARDKYDSKRR